MNSRRQFLQSAAAVGVAFAGLDRFVRGGVMPSPTSILPTAGYGPLVTDPAGRLDLPAGFGYRVISTKGTEMADGLLVPGAADGMAAFPAGVGKVRLVRNHELDPDAFPSSPFGPGNARYAPAFAGKLYDGGWGVTPSLGGTTTVLYDQRTGETLREHLSLAGTVRNCAGGATPWGTWITCEESVRIPGELTEKWHGYNFEVDPHDGGLATAEPIVPMGRFNHEAVCVDPRSGVVYQTEDTNDGCLYRYVPDVPGRLAEGGRLQALKIAGRRRFDARNWEGSIIGIGDTVPVEWVDVEDVASPDDSLRYQAQGKGAVVFARGEGAWWGDGPNGGAYFACTTGGPNQKGQIWRYTPSPAEGTGGEAARPPTLTLFAEPNRRDVVDNADNLTIAPWGDLIVCEDNGDMQHLRGITPEGRFYTLAKNQPGDSEFAGACFGPDGSTLFVNVQRPGLTLAITGPWRRRA